MKVMRRLALWMRDDGLVRADGLGDAARLARDGVGLADVFEERRFAMVDVAHDDDDRLSARACACRFCFSFLCKRFGH